MKQVNYSNYKHNGDLKSNKHIEIKRNGFFSQLFFNPFRSAAVIFVLLLIAILSYLVFLGFVNNLFFRKDGTSLFVNNSNTRTKKSLLAKISDIDELSTAEYVINTEIDSTIDFNSLNLPLGINFERQKNQVAEINGSVKAGINFSSITENDITLNSDKEITLVVPDSKIISVSINPEKTRLKKNSNSLITAIESLIPSKALEYENKINEEVNKNAKGEIIKVACSENILKKSQDNVNKLIESIYKNSGYEKVTITNKNIQKCEL